MSSSRGSDTVYGDDGRTNSFSGTAKGKSRATTHNNNNHHHHHLNTNSAHFNLNEDYLNIKRPFFVPIDEARGGLMAALDILNQELLDAGRVGILSKKKESTWVGTTVAPGEAGLYHHGGLPKIITKPGRYPGWPFNWKWFARSWVGIQPLSSSVINFNGLMIVQVSQNQAAVISDPSNKVFVVKNGGFVSLSISGSFRVLGVVDQVNLKDVVIDPLAGGKETRVLAHTQDVWMSQGGGTSHDFVAARFVDIPVVLQRGDDLELLSAGQHVITSPNITVRGFFSKGEAQLELPSRDMYTKDQVPVELRVYLRWQLHEPLKLCFHGYSTPYDALRDKTLSVLTQIVSHLEYASMVRQRSFKPGDDVDGGAAAAAADGAESASALFLDSLRTRAMDELHEAAMEYGIELRDLAVIDRKFKGEIAKQMDSLVTRALQAQVEASNIDRENDNKKKQAQGTLQVAQVQAQQRKTEADAQSYAIIAKAKAESEAIKVHAQAQAESVRINAMAEKEAIKLRSDADEGVTGPHARQTQLARIDVQRVSAYGNKTVFVPNESSSSGGLGVVQGYAFATGGSLGGLAQQEQTQAPARK
ncbi:hypothetical protein T439DRAFT_300836 [Meredithblackwellia eburnea MCA 4105]